jgi:branched-chain amino acid transport system substrate-binding protein
MLGARRSLAVAAAAALALAGSVPAQALAAQPQLVVLRFSGKSASPDVLDSATERAAAAALRVSAGRFKVVTRDMLAAIVGEERLLRCEEQARCELDLGVGLGTGYMLAGSIRKVGAGVEMAVKLYDVRKLDLLAQDTEAAGREDELLGRVGPLVERLMRTGLGLGGQSVARPPSSGAFEDAAPVASFGADAEEVVVAFESAPEGAAVRLDGQLLCSTTPCRKRVVAGAHQAVFEKERYTAATQKFTTAKGAVVKATLAPRFGWVAVETTPSGVGIAIDGSDVGKSPVSWREVDEGTAEVAVLDPCWFRSGERIAVKAGERRTVKLAPKPRLAGLKVNAEDEKGNAVEGDVRVDGVVAGPAGATLKVPVCSKRMSLPIGNQTFEKELQLVEGKVFFVDAKPEAVAAPGKVRFPGRTGTIKIASQAPLSGGQAALGEGIQLGAQLSVENFKGNLERMGYRVELVPYDDQAKPDVGVANAKHIIADPQIMGVIGHLNSGVAIPSSEIYKDVSLTMISPANTNPLVTERGYKDVYRVCGRDDMQGLVGSEFAFGTLKTKSVYIVHDKTTYGQFVAEAFKAGAVRKGMKVLGFEGTEEKSNFDPIVKPIKARNPDLIYYGGIYEGGAPFFKALREKGVKAKFLGPDGMDSSDVAKIAGRATVGMYYTSVAGPVTVYPKAKAFTEEFKKSFGKIPEPFSAQAYDAAAILIKAMENVVKSGKALTREAVAEAVRGVKFDGVTGEIEFDGKGDPKHALYFVLQVASDDPRMWGENREVKRLRVP